MHLKGQTSTRSDKRVLLFGLPLDIKIYEQDVLSCIESGDCLLTYLNPLAYSIVRQQPEYADNLARFDLIVCDGIGIQAAVKSVFKCDTPILTPDYSGIGQAYLKFAAHRNLSLCLVGASIEAVSKAAISLEDQYPGLRNIDVFCGYGEDLEQAKKVIVQSETDMVLVGMGMARQESYMLELKNSGWKGIGVCVGGFIDKLARPELQYPAWTEKTKLRFVGRLIREPRRLSKRYFIDYQTFIKLYLKQVFSS